MKLKNLPAGSYTKTGTNYISILDGNGCACDNCGRLIANMVYVNHESGKAFTIGQDCAKTLFDERINKEIDRSIKSEKRRQENEVKMKDIAAKQSRFKEYLEASRSAGIDNSNINTEWARKTRNSILDILEAKHGCYISYRA